MTPTEVVAKLRSYNLWRRGNLDGMPQPDPREIGEAIDAAVEMIESLEALRAELKAAHAMALNGVEWRELAKKYEAKIEAMERQEPYAFAVNFPDSSRVELAHDLDDLCDDMTNEAHEVRKLYLAPGAQPAPSVPEGWLRAIDEALVVAHIGVASADDTYEQAKAKLNNLIGFHVDVATDPAVNGGWKLVPLEPTPGMIDAAEYVDWGDADVRGSCINAWHRMLAAAPEAKP